MEEDISSYWMTLRKKQDAAGNERGSTRLKAVENSLWKMDRPVIRQTTEYMQD
jgi:hypothetical protein